ncbi:hemolysin secretion protein D [Cellvibrio zantedeschiae]|uniref:Hemolysin secretion protein D n=1 Tax=Cellvibrio zantedeschiae TaxID=1237077 RepID=A0ABQ3ARM5_9GAMM|nr:efflux RND transporter periplasmic adaptor subunit [Cellvibrio zantedeschiae]GGY65123.1 hemolysin secretion protein D [Cellvibrio zantedeschiae]
MRTIASIFIGLLVVSTFSSCSKPAEKSEDIRPVRAIQLEAAQQQVKSEYSGNVQARVESNLSFRVSGKIQKRKVDVGTLVKPGQVLMQLDPQDLRLVQAQAEANFKAAKSNFELAEFEVKRYQELRKTNAISQSAMDAKNTAFESAKANFEQAQAAYKTQSNQAAYASLTSDVEGVVTAINAEVGQVVAAGSPVVQVAKAGELEVVVGVPENNVEVIKRANQIEIRLWANPKEIINGKIRELSPVADAATRTFIAKVSILNPTPKQAALVKLGMTAAVQFVVNTPGAFVKVPLTALYQERGTTSVWIVEKNIVKLVPVQVGGVSGNDVLLTGGVVSGQTVVTAGVHVLNPGQRVSILPQETKPIAAEPYLTAQTLLNSQASAATPTKKSSEQGAAK